MDALGWFVARGPVVACSRSQKKADPDALSPQIRFIPSCHRGAERSRSEAASRKAQADPVCTFKSSAWPEPGSITCDRPGPTRERRYDPSRSGLGRNRGAYNVVNSEGPKPSLGLGHLVATAVIRL